jgi:hypothetical protein
MRLISGNDDDLDDVRCEYYPDDNKKDGNYES